MCIIYDALNEFNFHRFYETFEDTSSSIEICSAFCILEYNRKKRQILCCLHTRLIFKMISRQENKASF
jgi:hypothetical protein